MQRAAMADAARCDGLCSALRCSLHRTASYRAPHRSILSRGAWEAYHHAAPVRPRASHFSRKESGKPRQCFWVERASGCPSLFSFLRKNPHPTVRNLPKFSERSSIHLPETSRRTPKESSFICRRTPCVLRRRLHPTALLRRVSACCSLYRSTRGCQAGGRWG